MEHLRRCNKKEWMTEGEFGYRSVICGICWGKFSLFCRFRRKMYSFEKSMGRYPQTAKGHIIQALLRLDPVLDCCNPFSRSLRLLNITLSAVFIA